MISLAALCKEWVLKCTAEICFDIAHCLCKKILNNVNAFNGTEKENAMKLCKTSVIAHSGLTTGILSDSPFFFLFAHYIAGKFLGWFINKNLKVMENFVPVIHFF